MIDDGRFEAIEKEVAILQRDQADMEDAIGELLSVVENLSRRLDSIRPEVVNCRACGAKIIRASGKCGKCGANG